MNNNVENALQEFIKQVCISLGSNLDSIILYGSYARGDNRTDSDVDIMVLLKGSKEDVREYRNALNIISSRVGLKYDLLLAVVVKDKKSFEQKMPVLPFYKNVKKEGKIIYVA